MYCCRLHPRPGDLGVSQYPLFEPMGPLPNDRGCLLAHRSLGLPPPHCRHTPAPLRAPSPPPQRSRIVCVESSLTHDPTFGREGQWPASATVRQRLFISAISLPMAGQEPTTRFQTDSQSLSLMLSPNSPASLHRN